MRRHWEKPSVAKVMDEPCVLALSRGQLCAIQGALLDAEQMFDGQNPSSYPLFEIRAALARTEQVLSPVGDVVDLPVKPVCKFCFGEPVGNAASWQDGRPRPAAQCPRCGETNEFPDGAA